MSRQRPTGTRTRRALRSHREGPVPSPAIAHTPNEGPWAPLGHPPELSGGAGPAQRQPLPPPASPLAARKLGGHGCEPGSSGWTSSRPSRLCSRLPSSRTVPPAQGPAGRLNDPLKCCFSGRRCAGEGAGIPAPFIPPSSVLCFHLMTSGSVLLVELDVAPLNTSPLCWCWLVGLFSWLHPIRRNSQARD